MERGRHRNAPRGALEPDRLADLVGRGLTIREIARAVDRSPSTVRYWLLKLGLHTPTWRRKDALAARAAGESRFTGRCRRHGWTSFLALSQGRSVCTQCNKERVAARRRRVKETLIADAGGRCALCGYDRYPGALQFHHRDPSTKSFGLAHGGVSRSLERSRAEAAKCVLLCANCHAEVEGGMAALPVH